MVENNRDPPVSFNLKLSKLNVSKLQQIFVHRASLPSSEIAALDELPITFTMNIGVFIVDENRKSRTIEDLGALFGSNDIFNAHVSGINLDPSVIADIKTPAKLEQLLMKQHEVKPGNLLIIEWKNLKDEILVTSERTIFISDKVCKCKLTFEIQTRFNEFFTQHQKSFTK